MAYITNSGTGNVHYLEVKDGAHEYRIVRVISRVRQFFRWREDSTFHVEMSGARNANGLLNWEVARGSSGQLAVPRFILRYWLEHVRQNHFVQNPGTKMTRPEVVWGDHPAHHKGRSAQRLVLGCDRSLTREILEEVTPTGRESWTKAESPIELMDRGVRPGFKGMPPDWVQKIVSDVFWRLEEEDRVRKAQDW